MKKTLLKIKSNAKLILLALIFTKVLSTILFVPFYSLEEYLLPFINFSLFFSAASGYGVETKYEAIIMLLVLFISMIGWPASIILTLAIRKRVWIPVASIALMSVINICCCIESILSHNINGVIIKTNTLYPQKICNIIFCSIILLISIVYLVIHHATRDKYLEY